MIPLKCQDCAYFEYIYYCYNTNSPEYYNTGKEYQYIMNIVCDAINKKIKLSECPECHNEIVGTECYNCELVKCLKCDRHSKRSNMSDKICKSCKN